MANVSAAYLRAVSDAINAVSKAGQDALLARLTKLIEEGDYDDPVDLVQDALAEVEDIFQLTAEKSASISAQSYDFVRTNAVGEGMGAVPYPDRSRAATRKAFYGIARDHRHNVNAFVEGLMQRLDYEAKRAAGTTQWKNGANDPKRPRFARVPTGRETCPFCIMLASRGYVYWTAKTAGSDGHYHPHCDCRIVASYDSYEVLTSAGAKRRLSPTVVEGYDPEAYFDQYLDDLANGKLGGVSTSKYAATKAVLRHFGSLKEAHQYVRDAKDMDDLQARLNRINELFGEGALPEKAEEDRKRIYGQLIREFRKRYNELLKETGIEYDTGGQPKTLADIRHGDPMSFDDANYRRANPHCTDDNAFEKGYLTNCQTCVVANEMRRRGYYVEAKPRGSDAEKTMREVAHDSWLPWRTKDGMKPDHVEIKPASTIEEQRKSLEKVVEKGKRYTFEFCWKLDGAHIVCLDRDEVGGLRLYCPQTGRRYTGKSLDAYLKQIQFEPGVGNDKTGYTWAAKVRRIDNLIPVDNVITTITQEAEA